MTEHVSDVNAVRDITLATLTTIAAEDKLLTAVVPEGSEIEVTDLEKYLPTPRRKAGTVTLHNAASLAAYFNKHKIEGASTLYADVTEQRVAAIINEDAGDQPGWRDHRAVLVLEHTDAWDIWSEHDGQWMSQVQFAELVEDRLTDIVEPDGATMLEIALTFQSHTKANFESNYRLVDGQRQYTYTEETTSGAVNGTVEIPQEITLGIAPFEVSPEPYKVIARFRHRSQNGALLFGYKLDRPEDVIRTAFDDAVKTIEDTTNTPVLYGVPA